MCSRANPDRHLRLILLCAAEQMKTNMFLHIMFLCALPFCAKKVLMNVGRRFVRDFSSCLGLALRRLVCYILQY